MVSFHKHTELETTLHKKRKPNQHDDDDEDIDYETIDKSLKAKTSKFQEVVHYLQTPLPLEWQRCLDIKSGETYNNNTKANHESSSSRDSMVDFEAQPSSRRRNHSPSMSLDLDLHLPCGSHPKDFTNDNKNKSNNNNNNVGGFVKMGSTSSLSSSCLIFEGDDELQKELVTAVCHKCHMLIMMSKASLSCPNCKFIHKPQDNGSFQGLSL